MFTNRCVKAKQHCIYKTYDSIKTHMHIPCILSLERCRKKKPIQLHTAEAQGVSWPPGENFP